MGIAQPSQQLSRTQGQKATRYPKANGQNPTPYRHRFSDFHTFIIISINVISKKLSNIDTWNSQHTDILPNISIWENLSDREGEQQTRNYHTIWKPDFHLNCLHTY